ncbi:MAG: hypothetical protein ABH952_12610 [Candidatus Omnitrophota bacterium]
MTISAKAISTSIICHLIIFAGIRLVVPSVYLSTNNNVAINFLGPILISADPAQVQHEIPADHPRPQGIKKQELILPSSFDISKKLYGWQDRVQKKHTFSVHGNIFGKKASFLDDLSIKSKEEKINNQALIIIGAAANRTLISTSDLPKIHPVAGIAHTTYNMVVEFAVGSDGRVFSLRPIRTSGHTEIDILGMNFINSLRFVSLAQKSNFSDLGKALINFRIQ